MLAFSPPDVLEAVIERGLPAVGPRTITAPGLLLRELRRIRDTGIAYEHEESAHGVGCAASPVLSAARQPIGAISVCGPRARLTGEIRSGYLPLVTAAANDISVALGWRGGLPDPDGDPQP